MTSAGRTLLAVLIVAAAMLLLDAAWLRLRASMYRAAVSSVQRSPLRVRLLPGAVAYALMAASIPLVAYPAARGGSPSISPGASQTPGWAAAAASGAMLGAAVYGVFNATNAAIFRSYPTSVALQDTAWGVALFAAASVLYAWLLHNL